MRGISATDIGFIVGPRLNAAGRLDDMALGIELPADRRRAARPVKWPLNWTV
jgi:single-stranded DNA-specific DHH superfamily exonuclease